MREYIFNEFQKTVVFMKNRGGACIYVRKGIAFNVIHPPEQAEDSCWILIKIARGVNRVCGCVYRSSNSDAVNNEKVL